MVWLSSLSQLLEHGSDHAPPRTIQLHTSMNTMCNYSDANEGWGSQTISLFAAWNVFPGAYEALYNPQKNIAKSIHGRESMFDMMKYISTRTGQGKWRIARWAVSLLENTHPAYHLSPRLPTLLPMHSKSSSHAFSVLCTDALHMHKIDSEIIFSQAPNSLTKEGHNVRTFARLKSDPCTYTLWQWWRCNNSPSLSWRVPNTIRFPVPTSPSRSTMPPTSDSNASEAARVIKRIACAVSCSRTCSRPSKCLHLRLLHLRIAHPIPNYLISFASTCNYSHRKTNDSLVAETRDGTTWKRSILPMERDVNDGSYANTGPNKMNLWTIRFGHPFLARQSKHVPQLKQQNLASRVKE